MKKVTYGLFLLLGACTDTKQTHQNILPLGDSITEGVPFGYRYPLYNMLSENGNSFDFVGSHRNGSEQYPTGWDKDNEGHSGWMTGSIQKELPTWLPQYRVDVALIHLGTNDAGEGDVEDSAAAMLSIIEQLRNKNPSVAICLAQILPFGSQLEEEDEGLNEFVVKWNSRLADLVAANTSTASPILLADMHSNFGDADLDDGVHPTAAGAEKMAIEWFECISRL